MKLETNIDVLENVLFIFLSSRDLGKQTPTEQIPLLNVIAYQMGIDTGNPFKGKQRPITAKIGKLNLNNQLDYICAKIQLRNAVFMN